MKSYFASYCEIFFYIICEMNVLLSLYFSFISFPVSNVNPCDTLVSFLHMQHVQIFSSYRSMTKGSVSFV